MNKFLSPTVVIATLVALAGYSRADDAPWVSSKQRLVEIQIFKKTAALDSAFSNGGIKLTVKVRNKTAHEQILEGFILYAPSTDPDDGIGMARKISKNGDISGGSFDDLYRFKIPAHGEAKIELVSFAGLVADSTVRDTLKAFKIGAGPVYFGTNILNSKDGVEIKLPPVSEWK